MLPKLSIAPRFVLVRRFLERTTGFEPATLTLARLWNTSR